MIVDLSCDKKYFLSLELNSSLFLTNLMPSSGKSDHNLGKTIRGCFEVEDNLARGINNMSSLRRVTC